MAQRADLAPVTTTSRLTLKKSVRITLWDLPTPPGFAEQLTP
jgi:hypothetical protein